MRAVLAYAATIFSGAFLLFLVQPLIARYVLPWFGGSTGVWTTCLLFFQMFLLGGYAYAHMLSRRRSRVQVIVHLGLVVAALAVLPITPADEWKPTAPDDATLRILGLLAVTIGLPYFVLAATSPLMQHWFGRTHPGVAPFRFYALSNIGSMLALVSYPTLFETQFTRATQTTLWGWGLAVYAVGSGLCAVKVWLAPPPAILPSTATEGNRPAWFQRCLWLLLPACASVLLLATTNKICQDVATVPFLWVLPLSLYLLSFIICFDNPRWYRRLPFAVALILGWVGIAWALFERADAPILVRLSVYSAGLFACCMVCHGELYRLRPDPQHLTAFYLTIAGGGALGGAFVALLAPVIFTDYFEFQWGLLLCGALFLILVARDGPPAIKQARDSLRKARWRQGLACATLAVCLAGLAAALWMEEHRFENQSLERSRNFYGVLSVHEGSNTNLNQPFVRLSHGRIMHGLQFRNEPFAAWPTAYYGEKSGVGLCLSVLPAGRRRIGVVGLGVGTLATYARAGDYLHFYEINPEVQRLARTRFTYLDHCQGKVDVSLGDARLSLERGRAQAFDLLVLDAFSGDAIPVHLLTQEAFTVYRRHMTTNGIIAVHVSNHSVNLEPVIVNLARHFGYRMTVVENEPPKNKPWLMSATWILLGLNGKVLDVPAIVIAARPMLTTGEEIPLWTDNFTSVFQILGSGSSPKADSAFAKMKDREVFAFYGRNDFASGIACVREALEREPESPTLLADLAFLLFFNPDPSSRNIPEALGLAEKACRQTHYLASGSVGTLAGIYSEMGRYKEAAILAAKASALSAEAGDESVAQKYKELSAWFLAGHRYHEPRTNPATELPDTSAP